MADIKYYDVIKKPVITEKSMNAMAEKKYTFLVHPEANKSKKKEAVEKMFEGTKVKSVNTMNMDGKKKRRGMTVFFSGFLISFQSVNRVCICCPCKFQGFAVFAFKASGS